MYFISMNFDLKKKACLYDIHMYFEVLGLEVKYICLEVQNLHQKVEACWGNERTALGSVEAPLYSQYIFLF